MAKRAFGELESQILSILQSKERRTVKDVHLALGGQDNYNTVMTVMTRLVEKKQLARERVGLQYEYWKLSSTPSFSFINSLKQKFFGGTTSVLVNYLIENSEDLSEEDLAEMELFVQKARAKKNDL
jgi:predicted transcriptional regulator